MVISHKYKYVFVELPRTGTTAISKELCEHYDGEKLLDKHSKYSHFKRIASDDQLKYFVFSCVRNPLDRTVSLYFHLDRTIRSATERVHKEKNFLKRTKDRFSIYYFQKRYKFAQKENVDFSQFFLKFYKFPYVEWSLFDHKKFDFIIRFDNIQDDFRACLEKLGIEPVRELPVVNKTKGRQKDFLQYYNEDAIKRAEKVFGPFFYTMGNNLNTTSLNWRIDWWSLLLFRIRLVLLKMIHAF